MLSKNFIFYCPLLLLLSIFHSIRVFSNKLALPIMWPKCRCFSFSISPSNGHSGLISFMIDSLNSLWSQEPSRVFSNTTIQKKISSSAFSLPYDPTLTFLHDYWKNHSFPCMDFCQKINISAFEYIVQICQNFSSKQQTSFHFMVALTIHSDLGAKENKICHCFPFYLP